MKVSIFVWLLTCVSTTQISGQTLSQPDSVQIAWVQYYSGPDSSGEVVAMAIDQAGNIYLTGESDGDYATVKLNPDGVQQWASRHAFTRSDEPRAIALDAGGNVYITGNSDGGATIFDIVTIKYNANGDIQWSQRYNHSENRSEFASDVIPDGQGNVYVTGSSRVLDASYNNQRHYDLIVLKYNASTGQQQWLASFNHKNQTLGNSDDFARDMVMDASGNIYVTGTRDLLNQVDIVTLKFNPDGALQWTAIYTTLSRDEPDKIMLDGSGNIYVMGSSDGMIVIKYDAVGSEQMVIKEAMFDASDMALDAAESIIIAGSINVSGNNNFVTAKYNPTGQQEWAEFYDGSGRSDGARAMTLDGNGNIYVTGSSQSATVSTDFLTIKYNDAGEEQWVERFHGPTSFTLVEAIALDAANNIILAGKTTGVGKSYWTIVKYKQTLATSVADEPALPTGFALHQNYPNPFNPTTMIKYHLPKDSEVKLSIYNIFGQLVRTLVDKKQEAGFQSVEWDSQNEFGVPVASGVYIYRLEADDFVQAKKMLLLK